MSEPFVGEIKMFGGNFAPRGWALCDGQLLAVSQNDALFSLLGTIYGGDGRTTFALPDMRGRVPIHQGHGPGLSSRQIGSRFGTETETLTQAQMPAHTHDFVASDNPTSSGYPASNLLSNADGENMYSAAAATHDRSLNEATVSSTGGGQAHDNMMPFQCVNFIIALVGIYPSRQ